MKLLIIGAGWIGCHLTKHLKNKYNVTLVDSHGIFNGSSMYNQNRLHIGYHYSRDHNTRELCRSTYTKFLSEYGFAVDSIDNNYYVVPEKNSLLDYKTYMKIFEDFNTHTEVQLDYLQNISGAIDTEEKYINPHKCKHYFENILADVYEKRHINLQELNKIKKEYDVVINATNNSLNPIVNDIFSEQCDTLLYKRRKNITFGAMTFVDGKLFSIYPHDPINNIFSLSDVEFTPNTTLDIKEKRQLMESKVSHYYETFTEDFEFISHHVGKKAKVISSSDTRVPIISKDENIFSIFTGKIQGIYQIQTTIENALNK